MLKKISSINCLFWDTRKSFPNYPKELKDIYKKIYIKNYKRFSFWINEISKENINNINWWLSPPASRDERISNLFHNICIFLTIKNLKNKKNKIELITESKELKKIILKKINTPYIKINVISQTNFLRKILIFLKEISLLIINFTLIKTQFKKEKLKYLNIADIFEIQEKQKDNFFYGDFLKNSSFRKNLKLVPTFLSYSPRKIYRLIKDKKNVFFKESVIPFKDIFIIIKIFFFNSIILKDKKFLGINYNSLIREELAINNNFRSVLNAYLNYFFFKNHSRKKIEIKNVVSWFENQIVDKGWSLGVNHFYPNINFIGYQGATLHPQFFNLSPTECEFKAKILPKKTYIIGKKYIKNRKLFSKKSVYKITKFNRFDFSINNKKKYFLFLLAGFKHCDEYLLNIYKNFSEKFGSKNVFIKFHPILPSNNFNGIYKNEIKGNGSKIIQNAKFVITTSYTSGLYESLVNNSYTILTDYAVLDTMLYNDLKKYSKQIFLCNNSKEILKVIKNLDIKSQSSLLRKNNKIKKIFFNK